MFSNFIGASANGIAGVVPAEGSWVCIGLAILVLCAPPVWDVVIKLVFAVACAKILEIDYVLLIITH